MYFKHLEEIFLPKFHSQTCPAAKHHPKIEQLAKNERRGIKKKSSDFSGRTDNTSSKVPESLAQCP